MTTIRKIVTSKIDGNSADNNDTNEIRPFGEIAVYINTEPNPDKLTLMMFDGTRTHLKSMVLAPGRLYGSDADSGDGNGRDTIKLIPDASLSDYTGNDQYLIIDPTGGEPGHIHIRAGGVQDSSGADLYLGAEQTFVRVSDTNDNVVIRTSTLGEGIFPHSWTFDNRGKLTLPSGNTTIGDLFGSDAITSAPNTVFGVISEGGGGGGALQWFDSIIEPLNVAGIAVNSPYAASTGSVQIYTGIVGPTLQNAWTFGTDGKLTLPAGGAIVGSSSTQVGSSLAIATNSDGLLVGWGSQSLSVAYNADIINTYAIGSTITWQDGTTATITGIDNYAPTYIDIFWDTPKTGDLFPITLKTSNFVAAEIATARITAADRQWTFNENGWLTTPNNGVIQSDTLIALSSFNANNSIARVICQSIADSPRINLKTITSTGAQKDWIFDQAGTTTLPGAVVNSTVAKTGVVLPTTTGTVSTLTFSPPVSGLTDGSYPFTLGVVTFNVVVADGVINGTSSASSSAPVTINDVIGTIDSGDLGGTPGTTITWTVSNVVQETPTAIDLTKTVNKLTNGSYTLADGVEGQIMYLVRQTGAAYNSIVVNVANGRVDGALYTTIDYYPFETSLNMSTLIFTDGAWQASNGGWD